MDTVSITEAQERLSDLISKAEAGETIDITRQGRPIARLVPAVPKEPAKTPKRPVDVEALRRVASQMPRETQTTAEFIRRMRGDARY
jgi:prevent-host-death family protein